MCRKPELATVHAFAIRHLPQPPVQLVPTRENAARFLQRRGHRPPGSAWRARLLPVFASHGTNLNVPGKRTVDICAYAYEKAALDKRPAPIETRDRRDVVKHTACAIVATLSLGALALGHVGPNESLPRPSARSTPTGTFDVGKTAR